MAKAFFLLLTLIGVMMNSVSDAKTSLKKEVLAVSSDKFTLMKNADVEKLDKLLDSKFTLTHITGHVGSRSEWLNDLKNKRFVYHSIEPKSFSAKLDCLIATVMTKSLFDATIYGGRAIYKLELTEQYKKIDNKWKLMKMVAKTY